MVTSFSAVFTQATIFIQATIHLTRMIISPMKITKMFTRLTFTFLVLISSVVHATTDVTVTVDRNPVMVNESFVLEIVANDSLDGNDLDLTPIRQSGLVVGRTATSSSTQIINGSISKTTSWNVVLLARKEGSFTIPSLNIDGVSSKPLTVSVVKSNAAAGQNNQTIFLKNSIEQTDLYLQQTVKLVTRLYFAPNIDLQSGSLSDPSLDAAFIKQHGKDKDSSEIIMGVRYRVIERIYTVTPQSSGSFTIASPAFNGEISTGRRRSNFSNFGGTKPITSIGNDIDISVSSIPKQYSGSWLPSDLVMLNEEWQPKQDSYEVGTPITRTFTLTALNVNEEQLPEVIGTYPDSFKTYPDQSESHSEVRENAIVSQRVSTEAIVATKAGEFVLPAVSINWFNTKTKREEVATIPAKTITIIPSSNTQAAPMTNMQTPIIESSNISEQNCPAPNDMAGIANNTDNTSNSMFTDLVNQPILAWTGWVLWLLTSIIWFISRKVSSKKTATTKPDNKTAQYDKSALKQACHNNQANLVRAELLKWAKSEFTQPVLTLTALLPLVNPELQKQITLLQSSQYSKQDMNEQWSGKELYKAFKLLNSNNKTKDNASLPPLNG
jgi:hypothetical protein